MATNTGYICIVEYIDNFEKGTSTDEKTKTLINNIPATTIKQRLIRLKLCSVDNVPVADACLYFIKTFIPNKADKLSSIYIKYFNKLNALIRVYNIGSQKPIQLYTDHFEGHESYKGVATALIHCSTISLIQVYWSKYSLAYSVLNILISRPDKCVQLRNLLEYINTFEDDYKQIITKQITDIADKYKEIYGLLSIDKQKDIEELLDITNQHSDPDLPKVPELFDKSTD